MTDSSNPTTEQSETDRQLKILTIFHYVVAGLTALLACFPIIHLVVGITVVMTSDPSRNSAPSWFGWIFIIAAAAMILAGMAVAVVIAIGGRCLQKRRHYTFCMVVAAICCLIFPFGTILGVFTIVVLMRAEVEALFEKPA
jgi:hypothetical protein